MTDVRRQSDKMRSISVEQWSELAREGAAPAVTIRLDGDSMRPLIRREKDFVRIQPLIRPLKIGDVALFRSDSGIYVVHRVRKLKGRYVQTLGDNCWNPDTWIHVQQVLGLAVSVKRDGKTINLDSRLSRAAGRIWMRLRPLRNRWRSLKSLARRALKKILIKRK